MKLFISLIILLILFLNFGMNVDEKAMLILDESFNRAMSAFGLAKALNAIISLIQGTELSLTPVGIGMNFSIGEVLDPFNDMVERFSWVMLFSSVSLGLQKLLLILSSKVFLQVALGVSGLISLLFLLLLLVVSGLISGTETAFFSLTPSDILSLKNRNETKDQAVLELLQKPKRLLSTILITNNFVNVGIVILSSFIVDSLIFPEANYILVMFVQVVLVTSVILIFGEIIPKILANKEPMMFAHLMVSQLKFLVFFFRPMSSLLVNSTNLIDKKVKKKAHHITMSDLSDAIDLTVGENITEDEKKILKGIATFGETEATEIMQSRVNITAADKAASYQEVVQIVLESGFSRISSIWCRQKHYH